MPKARIADRKPTQVDLEPGRHSWCTCGHSSTQPFCDGSHRACSELRSLKFTVEAPGKAFLCLC